MLVALDTPILFKFKDAFSDIDGIYRVNQIVPYSYVLANDLDLMENLHSYIGDAEATMLEAMSNYVDGSFYISTLLESGEIFIIPESIVDSVNRDIKKYQSIMLTVDLGPVEDSSYYTGLIGVLADAVISTVGTPQYPVEEGADPIVQPKVGVQAYQETYLTYQQFEEQRAIRGDAIVPSETSFASIRVLELQAELDLAQTKILNLEEIIINGGVEQ